MVSEIPQMYNIVVVEKNTIDNWLDGQQLQIAYNYHGNIYLIISD